ncbi:polysaccharide lyase family 14 protein [Mycena amicta]|nr:polysaccharide lyase family 14 protein [Mycena amicta]
MISTHFYGLFVALLAVSVATADHEHHWSRRSHRAVARSEPVVAQVERAAHPRRKNLSRRTCKAALQYYFDGVLAVSTSGSESASASESATTTEEHTSTKETATKTSTTTKSTSTSGSNSGGGVVDNLSQVLGRSPPVGLRLSSPPSSSAHSVHTYMSAPDGKEAMRAIYPEGSWTYNHSPQGGISFYAPGPNSLDMTTAKELTFGYSVFFEHGFEFNKGGKLPGLSKRRLPVASGGSRSTACYSARLMWRTDGAGEVYTYLPDYTVSGFSANKAVCNVAPFSERGSYKFATGAWTTVSQRVRLNDVGKANGEIQLWVNGKSVINVGGLILRDSSAGRHRGIMAQTFFGGSTSDWASPKTQSAYFADFSVAITELL